MQIPCRVSVGWTICSMNKSFFGFFSSFELLDENKSVVVVLVVVVVVIGSMDHSLVFGLYFHSIPLGGFGKG